jgi:hypothetical protein
LITFTEFLGLGQAQGNRNFREILSGELNTWNRMEHLKLRKRQHDCNATRRRPRNSSPRQLSKPIFSQLRFLVSAVLTHF